MNQGSVAQFQSYNGVWQDGGMLGYLPSDHRWLAVFLAFQSQCWHTDDEKGCFQAGTNHCLLDLSQTN
jgi:uncharacterized protein YukJ